MKDGPETGQSVLSASCQFKVNTGSFRTFCSEEKEQPGRMDRPGLRCQRSTHHQRAGRSKTATVLFWRLVILVILRFLKSESPPNEQNRLGEEQVKNR